MRTRLCLIPAVACAVSALAAAAMQEPRPARQNSAAGAVTTGPPVNDLTFEHMNWSHDIAILLRPRLTRNDTIVWADTGQVNSKLRVFEANGNIHMTDPRADATGQKSVLYYAANKKLLVLTGAVQITVKPDSAPGAAPVTSPQLPAPSGTGVTGASLQTGKPVAQQKSQNPDDIANHEPNPKDFPAVITCNRLEYQYDSAKKHALLTGNLQVVQNLPDRVRTLTAEKAEWFGVEERLVLFPPVKFHDSRGTKADTGDQLIVHTHQGDDSLEMKIGHIDYQLNEDTDPGSDLLSPGVKAPGSDTKSPTPAAPPQPTGPAQTPPGKPPITQPPAG